MPTTAQITSNGKAVGTTSQFTSLTVRKEFNKIPEASLKLMDGNIPQQAFNVLDSDVFEPGKEIEIKLSHDGAPQSEDAIFKGVVISQGLSRGHEGPMLMVELCDYAVQMTSVRRNAVYVQKKDSEIIQSIIAKYPDLSVGTIENTTVTHAEMVQYYTSDWDFVVARAEANGQLVSVQLGVVSVQSPVVKGQAFEVALGQTDLYDFDMQANGREQYDQVSSRGWDIQRQVLSKPEQGVPFNISQGNYNQKAIAEAVGADETVLIHPAALTPEELKSWASAYLMKSRLSLLQGWVKIKGKADVSVGGAIKMSGVGKRFTGENVITAVRHEIAREDWVTFLEIGMDAAWFTGQQNVVDIQAAGLLPGINGLQVGLVVAHEDDPDRHSRIKIHIPAFHETDGIVWARLAAPDAGAGRGMFFRPEVGDEVIVGFLNDDPRQPVVLGAMHSAANKPPVAVTKKNSQKGIFTKQKYQLLFDEENEVITLSTTAQNKISIDQKQGTITLADAHGNQMQMNNQGITLASAKDMTITTQGNFEIKAQGNVTIGGKAVDLI